MAADVPKRNRSTTQSIENKRKTNAAYDGPKNKKLKPEQRTYTAFSWLNSATDVHLKSGGLEFKVENAGQRNPGLQGPHVIADITLDKVVEMRHKSNGAQGVMDLLGTGFAPPPEVVDKMLKADPLLRNAGSGHDSTEAHRDAYFKKYEKKYKKALATPISDGVALQRRVRTLMNMQPTATYAWGVGYATRAEMAGKGEREDAVLSDMESIAKGRKDTLTTVDFGFESHFPAPLAAAAKRNVEDLGLVHAGKTPRPLTLKDLD